MIHTESPGDNVDHEAHMRDVMADVRELKTENKALHSKLDAMTKFRAECERQFQAKVAEVGELESRLEACEATMKRDHAEYQQSLERSVERANRAERRLEAVRAYVADRWGRDGKGCTIVKLGLSVCESCGGGADDCADVQLRAILDGAVEKHVHVWEQTSANTGFCKLCGTPWETV